MKNLILHIPHSSIVIPSKEGYCVQDDILDQEILKLTDWYTDDLFENDIDLSCKAAFSRIFCDTERFSEDSKEVMAQFGMGVLYEKTDSGAPLRQVSADLRLHILKEYYWKHHHQFAAAVQRQLLQCGMATIIDCHSFPNVRLQRALDQTDFRPDFNIGTDTFQTPNRFIAAAQDFFNARGYSLGIDKPYQGTIVPMEFSHRNTNVRSMMLEVNRRLYLKEPTNEKSEQYLETKRLVQDFLSMVRSL
jgi:N-formylglutamate deformylase